MVYSVGTKEQTLEQLDYDCCKETAVSIHKCDNEFAGYLTINGFSLAMPTVTSIISFATSGECIPFLRNSLLGLNAVTLLTTTIYVAKSCFSRNHEMSKTYSDPALARQIKFCNNAMLCSQACLVVYNVASMIIIGTVCTNDN